MKLPIKKKYFDEIKAGRKVIEVRDAHITFVCEETGETLQREIEKSQVVIAEAFPQYKDVITDKWVVVFYLGNKGTEER
jgi:ASC-1-like (ASCH) protein